MRGFLRGILAAITFLGSIAYARVFVTLAEINLSNIWGILAGVQSAVAPTPDYIISCIVFMGAIALAAGAMASTGGTNHDAEC